MLPAIMDIRTDPISFAKGPERPQGYIKITDATVRSFPISSIQLADLGSSGFRRHSCDPKLFLVTPYLIRHAATLLVATLRQDVQAIRANLLASATTTTLRCNRRSLRRRATIQSYALPSLLVGAVCSSALDEEHAQIAVSALGDAAKDGAITCRHLLRHQPKPGSKITAFAKAAPLPTAATIALEMTGPIPGTVISCRQPSSARARASISSVTRSMRSSRFSQSATKVPDDPDHSG